MINEIRLLNLSFEETVILCHSIIALWKSCSLDKSTIPFDIRDTAIALANKYSEQQNMSDLMFYINELIDEQYNTIKQNCKDEADLPLFSERFQDKTLICIDCGKEFIFSAIEQEFCSGKGFLVEPKRCKSCRMAHKQSFFLHGGSDRMFDAIIAGCGLPIKIKFEPREQSIVIKKHKK